MNTFLQLSQAMVALSVKTIEKIRDDKSFDPFCAKVITLVAKFNVSDPSLPRKRKCPRRYEEGSAEAEFSKRSLQKIL